jgi:hypothetical protein
VKVGDRLIIHGFFEVRVARDNLLDETKTPLLKPHKKTDPTSVSG